MINLRRLAFSLISFLILSVCSIKASAQVKLSGLFTDGMVLQQQATVAVWGWDKAGTNITLITSWNKRKYTAVADASGKFNFKILTPVYGGPYQLTFNDGKPLVINNVLIGEVWICTGQSNMEIPMKGYKGQPILNSNEAILNSKNTNIRLFTVPRSSKTTLQIDIKKSQWIEASPESVANFSATGYYFGRLLNKMLNVPVGLINCSYAGASIQAWMDVNTLKSFPEIKIPAVTDSIKEVSRTPTTLYNAMMYPIIGYGIKGAIWYQGESNYDNPAQYDKLFTTMVDTLRRQWKIGNFPFYYAQIAPYDYAQLPPYNKGGKYNSAFLRDVQRIDAEKIPNAAMAVLMDVGEKVTIHPPKKEPVGNRLAYLALGNTYGIKGFGYQSPSYQSITTKGTSVVVKFKNAANGLTSFFKDLNTFEIAGADKHFYPAKAVITGSSVTVTSDQVKEPVAVRYAFKDFVVGDLFGTDGLPVSSFRTDDWDYDAN
jgi:sialate O-acetylesterase